MYIAIKLVSGIERGVELLYHLDGDLKLVTVAPRAEAKLIKGVDGYEHEAKIVMQGVLKPPRSGTYIFIVDALDGENKLVIEGRELYLRRDGSVLVSTPIHLLDTGYYRFRFVHRSESSIVSVKLYWLREDGVLEPIGKDHSYVQRGSTIVVRGLRDGCIARLASVGTVAEAPIINGIAEFNVADLKPPIDVCLEILCSGGSPEKVVCLSSAWGGDIYRIETIEELRERGLR